MFNLLYSPLVTVVAKAASIPMSNKEKQRYAVELKWNAEPDNFETRYTAPNKIGRAHV